MISNGINAFYPMASFSQGYSLFPSTTFDAASLTRYAPIFWAAKPLAASSIE